MNPSKQGQRNIENPPPPPSNFKSCNDIRQIVRYRQTSQKLQTSTNIRTNSLTAPCCTMPVPMKATESGSIECQAEMGSVRTPCIRSTLIAIQFSRLDHWRKPSEPVRSRRMTCSDGGFNVKCYWRSKNFLVDTEDVRTCEHYLQNGNKGMLELDLLTTFVVCILSRALSAWHHPRTCHGLDM